nr:hypothetical protein [Tanacetum cinerariifolium]
MIPSRRNLRACGISAFILGVVMVKMGGKRKRVHFLHKGKLPVYLLFLVVDNISSEGFIPSILLLAVIIVAVAIVVMEFFLGPVFLLVFSVFAMVAACVSRATTTLSVTNFLMAVYIMAGAADVDVLLEGILSS